jgi:acyl transferase domain-containing protein
MLQNRMIPPVACHRSLNPKIPPLQPDKLAIPTARKPWETEFRAALVNNYGAAGNNGALIVCQPPSDLKSREEKMLLPKFPVFISAFSETSLMAWCKSLREKVARLSAESSGGNVLADLAYSLSAKQNRSLPYMLATTAATLQELDEKLASASPSSRSATKPVVLIFGGQTNNHVGLSDCVYKSSILFRYHLDCCNAAIQKAGLQGILPGIFQTEPVEDIVSLHCMFFAIQYACAKSWMDSGLKIGTVVGHSFGQMTAMCISGCISLEDAVSLVSGRASLIRKLWGSEPGAMISLEADTETTLDIALKISTPGSSLRAEIACYNGPKSHVLVGNAASIDRVEEMIASERPKIRYRRLRVTNGFHSEFTEPILPGLSEVAAKITFSKPSIPLESCSTTLSWTYVSPERIVEHTRSPVYFQEAIERIAGRLGACTWLEAGAGSSVTGMVRQALGPSSNMGHTYHAIHLNGSEAMGLLADATVNLWSVGNSVQFWPFHRKERHRFELKSLPPYIFDKSRHWLMWKDNIQSSPNTLALAPTPENGEQKLLQFANNQSHDQITTEFTVNPKSEEYKMCVKGHAVLGLALCPADLYVEIVSKAAIMLLPEAEESTGHIPCTEDLSIIAPLGIDADRAITLSMTRVGDTERAWTFIFSSSDQSTSGQWTKHATGRIRLSLVDDKELDSEFARLQHLVGPKRPISLCKDPEAEGIQGNMVYRTFNEVVNYAEYYQGIKSVFGKGDEVAAQISMPVRDDWMIENMHGDPIAVDNFVQVAGIKVNCLNHSPADQVFICGHIERIQPSKAFLHRDRKSRSWSVYAHSKGLGEKDYHNDIYVFDENKQLAMLILGVRFTRVAIASLTKVLSTASAPQTPHTTLKIGTGPSSIRSPTKTGKAMAVAPKTSTKPASAKTNVQAVMSLGENSDVKSTLLNLLHSVADVPLDSIKDDSTFDELGVDSLTNTELLSEVCQAFDIEIPLRDFSNLQTVNTLRDYLVRQSALEQSSSSGVTSPPPLSSSESISENLSSAATSLSEQPELLKDNKRAKLAKLVAEQLETTVVLLTETCLGDLGLDSLLSVEIERDIEKAFGVELQPGSLTGETTFGQLSSMLSAQTSAQLVQDSPATDSVDEATIPLQSTSMYVKQSYYGLRAELTLVL